MAKICLKLAILSSVTVFSLAGKSSQGDSRRVIQTLFTPAHLHLAINHVPIIGLAVACLPVLLGILFHSRGALASGLVAVLLCVGTMPAIMETGEAAQESFADGSIDPGMDAVGKAAFREHSHRAKVTAPLVYAVGILALLALLTLIKFPRQAAWIGWGVLLGSAISISLSVWTAEAGGRIRHTEFRPIEQPSPTPEPAPSAMPSTTPQAMVSPSALATPLSSPSATPVPESSPIAIPATTNTP
jgi:hypothetical protein